MFKLLYVFTKRKSNFAFGWLKWAEALSLKQRLSGCWSKSPAKRQLLSLDTDNCWCLFYWKMWIYCASEYLLNLKSFLRNELKNRYMKLLFFKFSASFIFQWSSRITPHFLFQHIYILQSLKYITVIENYFYILWYVKIRFLYPAIGI